MPTQVRAAYPAGVVHVSEGAFNVLAAAPHQPPAARPGDPPAIAVDRALGFGRLAPTPPATIGLDETFSQQVHARHSYVPEEFVYDMRFADIIGTEPDGSRYVDYSRFDTLVPMGTKTEIA